MYDSSWNQLAYDSYSGEGANFKIKYSVSAGELYYIGVTDYGVDDSKTLIVVYEKFDIPTSGACGDNLTWQLGEDGTLIIRGTGPMYENSGGYCPWADSRDKIVNVKIEEGVTTISHAAFYKCENLVNIELPSSLQTIESMAFYDCVSLKTIEIPLGVTSIEYEAFRYCENLTTVSIPDSVTYLSDSAFEGCLNIENVSMPVQLFNKYLFEDTPWLKSFGDFVIIDHVFCFYQGEEEEISLPSDIVAIADSAFENNTSLSSVTIPDTVTNIGRYAFSGCKGLTNIIIPDGVTSISEYTFQDCTSLKSISLPNGLTEIGEGAFTGCTSLEEMTIPETVTMIGVNAFKDVPWLNGQDIYVIINGILISYNGQDAEIEIPENVTCIGCGAFEGCNTLKTITIPDNVERIGSAAFQNCTNLENVKLSNSLRTIEDGLFENCISLVRIEIPYGVTNIGDGAFDGCKKLTEIVIPSTVNAIGSMAFANTPWLKAQGDFVIINGILFAYNGQDSEVIIPDSVNTIANNVFSICDNRDLVKKVVIPASVSSIGDSVFMGCWELTSVTVLSRTASFGGYVFSLAGKGDEGKVQGGANFILYGYKNSTAEAYAQDHYINFVALDEENDISTCTITVDDATYTGEALTPAVTVKDGDTTLEKDTDYTLEYKNNVNAGIGTVTITGKGKYTGSVDKTFTIEKADQTMNVTITETAIIEGATASISADGIGTLTYSSSDEKVAEVDESGVVSGKGVGMAVITVTAGGNENYKESSGTVEVTVDHAWEEDYQIDKEPTCTEEGCKSIHCAYCGAKKDETAIPASGHHLTHVEAKDATTEAEGNIEYWYCSECDKYFKDEACTIEISKEETIIPKKAAQLEAIELNQSSAELVTSHKNTGDSTMQLKVTALPEGAAVPELTWTTSNEKVATVDQNGKVTALTYGKTTITVTAKENSSLTASCTIQTRYYDVDPAKYWYKHVYWAADKGITSGFENIYFGPEMNCTREQMITFLYREAGKPAVSSADIKKYNTFSDVESGKYYEKAVVWAAKNGITKGYTSGPNKGKFGVGFEVTREDTVTFLYRMAKTASSKFTDVTSADLNNKTYTFSDVVNGKYYQKAIVWAAKNGITKGYSSGENKGKFGVGFNVLRGDIVTFLSRYDGKFN